MTLSPAIKETVKGMQEYDERLTALQKGFLGKYTGGTLHTYKHGLKSFAQFLGLDRGDLNGSMKILFADGPGPANALVQEYMGWLRDKGRRPKTMNGYLSAVKAMAAYARLIGLITWEIQIKGVKADVYRDTQGPGTDGIKAMFKVLDGDTSVKAIRDRAILRLLWGLGLRRGAVVKLNREDIDLKAKVIWVKEKGRTDKERRTIPANVAIALRAWLDKRSSIAGDGDGPLFLNFDRAGKGDGRLTGRNIHVMINKLGAKAGIEGMSPHKVRHAAITHALDKTKGDIRKVQRFSGHRDIRTLQIYDDSRADFGGEVAALVDGDI